MLENSKFYGLAGKVQMRCRSCKKEYQIHEVADQFNPEIEAILENYTAIIYD